MPLREGSSDKVIQDNIKMLLDGDAGYDPPYKDPARKDYTPAQAAAIAYSKAGKRKNSAETLKGQKQTQSKQKSEKESSDNAEVTGPIVPEGYSVSHAKQQTNSSQSTMNKTYSEGTDHDKDGDIDSKDYMMGKDKAIKKAMGKEATADAAEDSDPCWKDYKQIGMKTKNGKQVPNCVPKSSDNAEESYSEISVPDGWSVSSNVHL